MDDTHTDLVATDGSTDENDDLVTSSLSDEDRADTTRGLLAVLASHSAIILGATVAAALSAAAYIDLDVAIKPGALSADQRPQYVLLALSSAVACLVALGALGGSFRLAGPLPRVRLERTILAAAVLTYGLQFGAAVAMESDFHALGAFVPSEADHLFQWTSVLGSIALFSALVIDAAVAGDSRPPSEVWWRGAVGIAAIATLGGSFVRLTAALTGIVYTHGDEGSIGITSVIAGAMVAASATRPRWWWRIGVGIGLAITGFGYIELGRAGGFAPLTSIAEDSLAIGIGYGVLALTGVVVLAQRLSSSRTPRDLAPYPG